MIDSAFGIQFFEKLDEYVPKKQKSAFIQKSRDDCQVF